MKKSLFVLFICVLLIVGGICSASAESIVEVDFFTPQKSEYVALDSPYLTASNDSTTVVFDNDGFKVAGDEIYSESTQIHYNSAVIYDNILFATADDYSLLIYDIELRQVESNALSSISAFRVALDEDTLYLLTTENKLTSYSLDNIQNPTLISSVEYLKNKDFAITSRKVVYYSYLASTHYLNVDSSSAIIDQRLSDLSVYENEIFVLFSSPTYKEIHVYDSTTLTYKRNFVLPYESSNVEVTGDKLFVTYPEMNSVDVYSAENFNYLYSICSSGNQDLRFNSPSRVYAHGDYVTVADENNSRLLRFNSNGEKVQSISLDAKVSDVIDYGQKAYALIESTVRMTTGGASTVYDKADGILFTSLKSLAVDCFGTVYAIDNGRIVSKGDKDSTFKVFANTAPLYLTVSPKGSVLYALYQDKISAYDSLGKIIFTSDISSLNLTQNAVCDCDVGGNMYILDENRLIRLNRSLSGFAHDKTLKLGLNGESFVGSSISISTSGALYLTQKDTHAVFTLDKSITGASVYNSSEFTPPVDAYEKTPLSLPLTFVKVNAGGGFVYDFSQSYENTRVIQENTLLYLLDNQSINGFYFVYYSGKVGFIPTTTVTVIEEQTFSSYDAFALVTTEIYKYPNKDSAFKMHELLKGTSFKVIGDANGFTTTGNGKTVYWNEILYDEKVYYIERTHIAPANPTRAVDFGYAKLRAPSVGTKICVYALPDENSAVLGEYSDGTEVKLLSEIDEGSTFTEIKIGDLIGYVKTSELTTNGLTTAQTVILILVLIGGLASVTILIVSRKMHRKN